MMKSIFCYHKQVFQPMLTFNITLVQYFFWFMKGLGEGKKHQDRMTKIWLSTDSLKSKFFINSARTKLTAANRNP